MPEDFKEQLILDKADPLSDVEIMSQHLFELGSSLGEFPFSSQDVSFLNRNREISYMGGENPVVSGGIESVFPYVAGVSLVMCLVAVGYRWVKMRNVTKNVEILAPKVLDMYDSVLEYGVIDLEELSDFEYESCAPVQLEAVSRGVPKKKEEIRVKVRILLRDLSGMRKKLVTLSRLSQENGGEDTIDFVKVQWYEQQIESALKKLRILSSMEEHSDTELVMLLEEKAPLVLDYSTKLRDSLEVFLSDKV